MTNVSTILKNECSVENCDRLRDARPRDARPSCGLGGVDDVLRRCRCKPVRNEFYRTKITILHTTQNRNTAHRINVQPERLLHTAH